MVVIIEEDIVASEEGITTTEVVTGVVTTIITIITGNIRVITIKAETIVISMVVDKDTIEADTEEVVQWEIEEEVSLI